jgi:hypothetical protein
MWTSKPDLMFPSAPYSLQTLLETYRFEVVTDIMISEEIAAPDFDPDE